jgi:competence protein ComEA
MADEMFLHMPPKERVAYACLLSIFVFAAGYVGAQQLRPTPKIVIDTPKDGKSASVVRLGGPSVGGMRSEADLVVHVVGSVKSPGLQHLPLGSRVDDAVKAAGGATADADLESINLAAKLEDGQQVAVPKKGIGGEPAIKGETSSGGGKHPDHPINLSSSSYAELEELPGVGPSMAEKLLAYRLNHGHLSFQDLRAIPGLGPKKLEKIKPWVKG